MGRVPPNIAIFITFIFLSRCGGQQLAYDCPVEWVSNNDQCYHFVLYPSLTYDEASQACHQDGANLVSVETTEEHTFIVNWLNRFAKTSLNQFYTSGLQRQGHMQWAGVGEPLSAQQSFWVIDPATESEVSNSFIEAHLIYQYSEKENRFGWAWASRTLSLPYICEIKRSEVYRLYQRERDFSYGGSADPADWLVGPKIVFNSPNTVFTKDTPKFSLECVATGNPTPTFQWFKLIDNGRQPIHSTDHYTIIQGRLTIINPSKQNDVLGTYACMAENPAGKVLGNPILVSSGYLNEFSNVKPGRRTALLYQGAVIDCNPPSFSPAIVFNWAKNGHFIRPELNPYTFLSRNGNLYISEIQAADAGEYMCFVALTSAPGQAMASQQEVQRNSLGITLDITGVAANEFGPIIHDDFPAVFPQQPLSGKDMHLECFAYGTYPLQYAWSRLDGGNIPDRAKYSIHQRLLTITEARIEDSGIYRCTVQGRKNFAQKNISISVAAAPYFRFPLLDQHLDKGSNLTWVCDAVAIPEATCTWYKDAVQLVSNTTMDIEVKGSTVIIYNADASKHNGMYECLAKNDHGTEISSAQIRVLSFAPNFHKHPVEGNLMGALRGNVTIPCRPEAAPQPTVTWTFNGAPIGDSGHAQVMPNGNLVLNDLTKSDAGRYTCVAENFIGKANSSGQLNIIEQTTIVLKPLSQQVPQNSSAHLPCEASYNAHKTDLVYVWYFNGKPLDIKNEPSLNIAQQAGVQGLAIVGTQYEHEGWYECRATTAFDVVTAEAYLTVLGPPDEPAGVHVHSYIGTEITLWWQPGLTHGEPITLYRIEFSNNFNHTWLVLINSLQASQTQVTQYPLWRQYVIPPNTLSPGTNYTFRVSAASARFGFGRPSIPSESIKLLDAPPIFAPELVTGGGGSVGMLQVRWLPLPQEHHGGSGVYYKVYWRKHRNPDDNWISSNGTISGSAPDRDGFIMFNCFVGEENYYTEYDVMVQAWNSKGPGPNSTVEIIMSAEDIPVSTPMGVVASGYNASAGFITWQLPNNTREGMRGKVLGFQINWWLWSESNDRQIIGFKRQYGPEMEGLLIGLYANGDYWVDVQVFNTAGLSRPSGQAYLNTNYEAPLHYPFFVTVTSHGPESVYVTWQGVSTEQIEAPVSGYKIWYWPYTDNIRSAQVATFGKEFSGILTGIEKDKVYKLRVLGTSAGGDGKKSPPTFFTLGGQIRFDPRSSEIMASASLLYPSCQLIIYLSLLSFTV